MRLSPREDRKVPQSLRRLAKALAISSLFSSTSQAIEFTPAPSANLDFSKLGRIGVAGDFDGISLYQYEQQNGLSVNANGSDALWVPLPNGELISTVSTDASIRTMCTFKLSDGKMAGVVVAGNFTSVDGTKTTAAALYDPDTGKVSPLDGLEGEVNALFCDQDRNTVYVGGNFKGAASTNAISWVGTQGWTNLPFAGFNGPVEAISKATNGHIIFGGSFTALGNTSAPRERDGQSINLSTSNISAINSISTTGFSDPHNIICSSGADAPGQAWLLSDGNGGAWDAEFGFMFTPTKLRLWNTHQDGRGTKNFYFTTFPLNGILNLTYVDPATGKNQSCTNQCTLTDDPKVPYQDFHFVNPVSMNHVRITITSWYGKGGGLAGIQLFQDDIFAYAVNRFNEPSCRDIDFPSTATTTGPWKESPSLQSSSKYLTVRLTGDINTDSASVTFKPNIRQAGNYSVNLYTPGCLADDTCDTRGRINVTGTMSSGSSGSDFSLPLWQVNNYDKYEQIYFGYIDETSDSFEPTVTLSPLAGQDLDTLTVVAQRIGFTLLNSTGKLNGLYEFDPDKAVVGSLNSDNSTFDKLGSNFNQDSAVKALVTIGDTVYVGGNFTSDEHVNIMSVESGKSAGSLDGGLDGQVLALHVEDSKLYAGGDFTTTLHGDKKPLNRIAVYDPDADTWNPLGAGVDGSVSYIVPILLNVTADHPETVLAVTGNFTKCLAFGDDKDLAADGLAIWVLSKSNWLNNLDLNTPTYNGVLTASVLDLPNNGSLYAGAVSSAQIGANGIVSLGKAGLGEFGVKIQGSMESSQLSRRDTVATSDISGVVTGKFYNDNGQNLTVFAGHFTAKASNGSTVNNLAFLDGNDDDTVSGLGSQITADSVFVTLDVQDSTLYAGGRVNGTVDGSRVAGVIAYDLDSQSFADQPAPISGGNATVSSIRVRPSSSEVFVGGSFDQAGALDCPGVCVYNPDSRQWNRPGSGFRGDVYSMMWSSKTQLVVGGNLTESGGSHLAAFDAKKRVWTDFDGASAIPGPVYAITPASDDESQIWITGISSKDGSTYLMKYDGSKWQTADVQLSSSTVRGLQVFSLTESHDDTDLLDSKQVLMLTGAISLPDFGTAAAVLYNGTDLVPYALTTGSGNAGSSIAGIFSQSNSFFSNGQHHLALGFVVLIGLAVALALILLIVVGGVVLDRIRKRREGYTPAPTSMYDRSSGMQRIPPSDLFQSLGRGRQSAPQI